MQLKFLRTYPRAEIMHYADARTRISSYAHTVCVERDGECTVVSMPRTSADVLFGRLRLARRALRLDKCNVVPVADGLVIIRQGRVYHYSFATSQLRETLRLALCRNTLHRSVCVLDGKTLFFGEYGRNKVREPVPVYKSTDGGHSWTNVFSFPAGRVKHVHGCYWDPVEEKIWTLTGDFAGECFMVASDQNFETLEWIGDGQQLYRACNVFFEEDAVHWIMDSPLETSYHVRLDRKTRRAEKMQAFPGPVWYIKKLEGGPYVVATTQEPGPGLSDRLVRLYTSHDLVRWEELQRFEHDGLPMKLFKFGVLGMADGVQTADSFYLFYEAIKGLDGTVTECRITL